MICFYSVILSITITVFTLFIITCPSHMQNVKRKWEYNNDITAELIIVAPLCSVQVTCPYLCDFTSGNPTQTQNVHRFKYGNHYENPVNLDIFD